MHMLWHSFYVYLEHHAGSAISSLSLHDALPIWRERGRRRARCPRRCRRPRRPAAHARPAHRPARDPGALMTAPDRVGLGVGLERSEEHTSELQSRENLVCRLLLEKKKRRTYRYG